jgi:hypothetical protein
MVRLASSILSKKGLLTQYNRYFIVAVPLVRMIIYVIMAELIQPDVRDHGRVALVQAFRFTAVKDSNGKGVSGEEGCLTHSIASTEQLW